MEWGGGGELQAQSSTEELIPSKQEQGSKKEMPMDELDAAVDIAAPGKDGLKHYCSMHVLLLFWLLP